MNDASARTGSDLALTKAGLLRAGRTASPISRKLVRWMREEALPLWATRGWDGRYGGFHERIGFDGKADDAALRRTRVQWRQIYVYSHAALLGWHDGLRLALKGLEHMIGRAWAPDGIPGFVHILNPDGSVSDKKRDSYDHAFALLALTWLAKASGDAQVHALLNMVFSFCTQQLTDENGFLREAIPPEKPHRQNPHMHMLEAMLAMVEVLNHADAKLHARRYRNMLEGTFFDPETALLIEFFDDHWRPVKDETGASLVEPGHMAEWVWLIRKYERLFGQKSSPLATHLLGAALRGAEPMAGFLIDEIDTNQKARKTSRRLWPQTELVKAWLAQVEIGADRADEAAEQAIEALMTHYLAGPFSGGWYDQFDGRGGIAGNTVPASTLYHLFVATAESHRLLGS
jgi:mannose/cellobiose epimerase-like protein (N-acyl-D-glucosamine 2-epimerase family)